MIRFSRISGMALLLMLNHFSAQAGPSVVVLSDNYDKPAAVRYKMRADYIAQTVIITSNEGDFSAKLKSINNGKKYLIDQIGGKEQIVVHEGPAHLFLGSILLAMTNATGSRVFAFISPSPRSPPLKGGEEFGMGLIVRLCPE
jgi:hypothetical protein